MLDVREGDPEQHVISGGAFLSREGVPHVIYHGKGASANRIAAATDEDLKEWKKLPGDFALKALNPQTDRFSVFEPDAWYDEKSGDYYQISGGMKPGLFKSKDMRAWHYLGNAIGGKR